MDMPLISVVVPVHNTENYIEKCLESIRVQTLKDFECIIVDNGSTDNSGIICDKWAQKDHRFKVFHQEDKGPGGSRMAGASAAVGKALTFADSDDYLTEDALLTLWNRRLSSGAKVVVAAFTNINVSGEIKGGKVFRQIKENESALVYALSTGVGTHGVLFDTELLRDIETPMRGCGDDNMICVQIFSKLKKEDVIIINKSVYNYVVQSGSSISLRSLRAFYAKDMLDSCYGNIELLMRSFYKKNYSEDIIKHFIIQNECGYLHYIAAYLVLNKNRPSRGEIEKFYSVYKKYKNEWRGKFYEKFIIASFGASTFLGRILRLPLLAGNYARIYLHKGML